MFSQKWGLLRSPDDGSSGATDSPVTPAQPVQKVADTPDAQSDLDLSKLPEAVRKKLDELEKYNGELRRENEKRRKSEADAEAKRKSDEQAAAEKRGEWEKVAQERAKEIEALLQVKERADKFEAQIKATNETRIKRIPEAMRPLVPTDYSPEKLAEWLDKTESVLVARQAPNLDAGDKGEKGKKPINPTDVIKKRSY